MPPRQLKIMVVDDHTAFRAMVKTMVETAGWICLECDSGQAAVEQFAKANPDLVLMDIAMEPLNGIQATAQIKTHFPAARIMMLTQYDDPHFRAAAEQAGACGYILKENLLGLQNLIQAETLTAAAPAGSLSGSSPIA